MWTQAPNAGRSWATIRRSLRSALIPKSNGGQVCTQNHTRNGNLNRRCAAVDAEKSEEIDGLVKMLTIEMLKCWNAEMLKC